MSTTPLHEHCETCIKVSKCNVPVCPPFSCEIVSCGLDCGRKFHRCKTDEHAELCDREKVPCINSENGCPVVLLRHRLAAHLLVCPASVLQCTMEWNRWPVYCKERQARVPFTAKQHYARYEQLDVALALRDQRMLNRSMNVPAKTRRILRNGLNKRFPAVPISHKHFSPEPDGTSQVCSNNTSCTVSDDDSDAPWQQWKNPPGLQASVCNELFRATKITTDSLTAALNLVTTSETIQRNAEIKLQAAQSEPWGIKDMAQTSVTTEAQTRVNVATTETSLETTIDPVFELEKILGHPPSQTSGDLCDNVDNHTLNLERVKKMNNAHSESMSLCHGDENLMFDHMDIGIGSNICNPNRRVPPVAPPVPGIKLQDILGLDINVESIAPYQHKPKSMYTFLCAQVFRRNEFPWHFRNMHGDIVSNLNGWLEQRCPLASQGCTFSMRRLHPIEQGAEVVYNSVIEAFGVKPDVPRLLLSHRESVEKDYLDYLLRRKGTKEATPEILTSKDFDAFIKVHGNLNRVVSAGSGNNEVVENSTRQDLLTGLPVEILQHIGRFLDGFSLNNLALTSKLLRDVCCSLLEEKGLVVQEWEKAIVDNKPHWVIAYQRWMFSTCFHPIKKWAFGNNPHLSEHMKQCPFYVQAEQRQLPVKLMMGLEPEGDQQFIETMQKMYPAFQLQS